MKGVRVREWKKREVEEEEARKGWERDEKRKGRREGRGKRRETERRVGLYISARFDSLLLPLFFLSLPFLTYIQERG